MKTIVLRLVLTMTILAPLIAPAELVVYKGTRRETFTGEGHGMTLNWRMILLVDHDTAQAAGIHFANINGMKRYWTKHLTNTHFVHVAGPVRSFTAISRPIATSETEGGLAGESVFCKGVNATLTVNTNATVFFPRVMSSQGNGLFYSKTTGQPVLGEDASNLVFDRAATIACNKVGETLEAAFARHVAYVESLGFRP